jgi:hypothetical protein
MSDSKAVNARRGREVQDSNSQPSQHATNSSQQRRNQVNQQGHPAHHIDDSLKAEVRHSDMNGYTGGKHATVVPVSGAELVQIPHSSSRQGAAGIHQAQQQQNGVAPAAGIHRKGNHAQRAVAQVPLPLHERVSWSDEQGYPLTQVSSHHYFY